MKTDGSLTNLRHKITSCNDAITDQRFQAPDNEYIVSSVTAIEDEDYSFFTNTEDVADDKIVEVWRPERDTVVACQLSDELFSIDDNYIQRQINAIRRTDSLQLLANKALRVC